jgi:hypothetical protein
MQLNLVVLEMTTSNWKEIEALVQEDIRCHRENGVDLNPYSTNRARQSWQNGFDDTPFTLLDWAGEYQRGKVAALIMKEVK